MVKLAQLMNKASALWAEPVSPIEERCCIIINRKPEWEHSKFFKFLESRMSIIATATRRSYAGQFKIGIHTDTLHIDTKGYEDKVLVSITWIKPTDPFGEIMMPCALSYFEGLPEEEAADDE